MNQLGIGGISKRQKGISKRVSSYDTTGGNKDFIMLDANETRQVCLIEAPGCIRHIWVTMTDDEKYMPRKVIIRMFWDNEAEPSVEAPIGDFFGLGHGMTKNFSCAPFAMSPQDGKSWNCFFPMPFSKSARIEIENQSGAKIKFYYYFDYVELEGLDDDQLRFHAQWRREMPTDGVDGEKYSNEYYEFGGRNTDGEGNYVILDAQGRGHYVGCNYNVHNLRFTNKWNWYGEGDDMIFIDGEKWPPSMHGTGTEDYFNTAWCPQQEQAALYHGLILCGGDNWSGKSSYYRYHILDPIMFEKSIKVTIEHGHNNHRSDDVSTTAYWYQSEPHKVFPKLLDVKDRLPLEDILEADNEEVVKIFGE